MSIIHHKGTLRDTVHSVELFVVVSTDPYSVPMKQRIVAACPTAEARDAAFRLMTRDWRAP